MSTSSSFSPFLELVGDVCGTEERKALNYPRVVVRLSLSVTPFLQDSKGTTEPVTPDEVPTEIQKSSIHSQTGQNC